VRILGMKNGINGIDHTFIGSDGKGDKKEVTNFRRDTQKKVLFIRDLNIPMTDKHVHKLVLEIDKNK
jgi:hypothetical protein